jgi:hypothetical protein
MAVQEADNHPPKPRLTLRVGVTGKRTIPEAEVLRIRASLAAVFDALAGLVVTCRAEHQRVLSAEPALLRVVSGMAEGADQLAAEVAIERFGRETAGSAPALRTSLAAILPFAREEYKKDFAQDPNKPKGERARAADEFARFVAHFDAMLGHPATEAVLEIDDETLLNAANPDDRNLAYANLRDVLLEHSDVLVAVSDDIDGGAGGTVDVIRTAMRAGIPVVKISTRKPDVYLMQAISLDRANQTPEEGDPITPGAGLPEKLAAALRLMISPPGMPSGAGHHDEHHAHEDARPARARLELFFREVFAPRYFDRIFKSFRDALTVKPEPDEYRLWKALTAFRTTWLSYRRKLSTPQQKIGEMWPDRYNAFAVDGGERARRVLAARHGWADVLAVGYADATRSAHIAIAVLGALAVFVAVVTLIMPEKPDELAVYIKICALAIEVLVLLTAGRVFFRPAHDQRWHERMVEYRAIAELLRHERFVYALGAADRPGKTADRTWSEPDAWVGWYVRATLRELGFPGKTLSVTARQAVLDAFAKDELEGKYGQIAYNESLAERFHTIDRRLEKTVRRVFWLTVYAGIVGIVLLTLLGLLDMMFHSPYVHGFIHFIKPYFTVIAASIPALIAAIHGVRFQIEFRSAAIRAEATMRELIEVDKQVNAALAAPTPSPGRKQSVALVRAANEAMSADLAGWSSVYRGKGPELG